LSAFWVVVAGSTLMIFTQSPPPTFFVTCLAGA
jgi:hypothetical protein